ncbi:acyl-CoA dehydrogenase family protein [Providencia manganoxydans]|uniref:acyl-CoA dehydrogenase family protein n=1 Tax=Providencia manganoxydans TaxID=2923283 RepID=UPI0034E421A5
MLNDRPLKLQDLNHHARQFAHKHLYKDLALTEHLAMFDHEGWIKCAEFGLFRLAIPEKFGGKDATRTELIAVMEGLGYGCEDNGLLFSINAHLWTVVLPLIAHGTPEQQAQFLPSLLDGSMIGANASTEEQAGSDVFSMQTQAVKQDGHYILNGTKCYITNAPIADLFVIYANIDPNLDPLGITAFLVPSSTPGLEISSPLPKMGMRTAQMGKITLKDCRIPVSSVLGKIGRGMAIFENAMENERGCLLASALGTMQRQLENAIQHARTRKQFDHAISKNQAVSHRLVDMKVSLDAAREMIYRVARLKDEGHNAFLEAASAKLFVSETYTKFSLDVFRLYGAQGYLTNSPAERGIRDSIASLIYSGTSDIQRNIIAMELGL